MEQNTVKNTDSYITLDKESEGIFTEKKSVFHAFAAPITHESEANRYIASAKEKFPDAVHHVYAWVLGGENQRNKFSDDGEPSGTAGMPVLDILRKRNIDNAIVIVSRYFGGTLLGTGGLVRAYSTAAMIAVEKASPVMMIKSGEFTGISGYHDFEKIRHSIKDLNVEITQTIYESDVKFKMSVLQDNTDKVLGTINDVTCGRTTLKYSGTGYIKTFM